MKLNFDMACEKTSGSNIYIRQSYSSKGKEQHVVDMNKEEGEVGNIERYVKRGRMDFSTIRASSTKEGEQPSYDTPMYD